MSESIRRKKGLSPMIGFFTMIGVTVLAVAARAIQLFCAIDYETGFYKSHFSVTLLNVILWVGIPLSILLTLIGMSGRYKAGYRLEKSFTATVFLAAASALTGIQTLGMIYSNIYFVAGRVDGAVSISDWLLVVLLAGSCIAFAASAVDSAKGRPFGFYIAVPALYTACKLMMTFMKLTTIANISENLFNILSLSSAAVFLCQLAKIGMGFAGKSSSRLLVVSAFCAAVFGFVYVVPNYILTVCDMIDVVNVGGFADSVVSINLDEFAVCILAAVYTGVFLKRGKNSYSEAVPGVKTVQPSEAAGGASAE